MSDPSRGNFIIDKMMEESEKEEDQIVGYQTATPVFGFSENDPSFQFEQPSQNRITEMLQMDSVKKWVENQDNPQDAMAKVEFAEAINRQMGIPIKQVIDNYETFGTELFDTADAQTGLQSLRKAMESGMYTVNLASAASDYLFFGRGDIDSIREMALNPPYVDKNQGPLVRIGQALLQNAPLQVSNRLKGLTLGFAAGGGAALSTYLATSPVTGAIPGPLDEFIAAGGAFSMAFAPAYKAATAIETAKSQAGLTFANLISMKAKDSEGNDVYIKESHAKWLAAGLGGISGLLEFLQTEQLISGFPGVKNILTGKVANTITRTINSNRFASFAGRFLKNYTLTMGTESLQEVAQESIDIFAENLAAEISGKRRRTVDDVFEQAVASGELPEDAEKSEIWSYINKNGGVKKFQIGQEVEPIFDKVTQAEILDRFEQAAIETIYYTVAAGSVSSAVQARADVRNMRSAISDRIKEIRKENPNATASEVIEISLNDDVLKNYRKADVQIEAVKQERSRDIDVLRNIIQSQGVEQQSMRPDDPIQDAIWEKANKRKAELVKDTEARIAEIEQEIERGGDNFNEEATRRAYEEWAKKTSPGDPGSPIPEWYMAWAEKNDVDPGQGNIKIGDPTIPEWYKNVLIEEKKQELINNKVKERISEIKNRMGEQYVEIHPSEYKEVAAKAQEEFGKTIDFIESFYEENKDNIHPDIARDVLGTVEVLREEQLRAISEVDIPLSVENVNMSLYEETNDLRKQLLDLKDQYKKNPSDELNRQIATIEKKIKENESVRQRNEKLFNIASFNLEKANEVVSRLRDLNAQAKEASSRIEYFEGEGKKKLLQDIANDYRFSQDEQLPDERFTEYIARINKYKKKLSDAQKKQTEELANYMQSAVDDILKPVYKVDPRFARAIDAIQESIDPRYLKQSKRKQLIGLKKAYEGTGISTEELQKMDSILRKNIKNWTVEDLGKVRSHVAMLRLLGKESLQRQTEETAKVINNALDAVREVSGYKEPKIPMGSREYEKLTNPKKIPNLLRRALNPFLPPDRWADMLDGGKATYDGPNTKIFIDDILTAKSKFVQNKDVRMTAMLERFKKLGLKLKDFSEDIEISPNFTISRQQAMMFHIAKNNEEFYFELLESNNIDTETANYIVSKLTEEEKIAAEAIGEDWARSYPRLRDAYLKLTGNDLGFVNYYIPMKTENYVYKTFDEELSEQIQKGRETRRRVQDEMTKKRDAQTHIGLRYDMLNMWYETVMKQEYYIALSDPLKTARTLSEDTEFQAMVRKKFGKQWNAMIDNYLTYTANSKMDRTFSALEKLSLFLQRNFSRNWLLASPTVVAKQVPSALNYMAKSGPAHFQKALNDFIMHPMELVKVIEELDPVMKDRGVYQELDMIKNNPSKYEKIMQKYDKIGLSGVALMDRMATTVGWWAVYNRVYENTGDMDAAVREARKETSRHQPTRDRSMLPEIYRDGYLLRWFTMFTQQPMKNLMLAAYDLPRRTKAGSVGQAAIIAGALAMNLMAMYVIDNKKIPDEPEELSDMFMHGALQWIPIVGRRFVSYSEGYWDTSIPPFKSVEAAANITNAVKEGKIDSWTTQNAIEAMSLFTGFPYGTAKRAYKTIDENDIMELVGGWPDE